MLAMNSKLDFEFWLTDVKCAYEEVKKRYKEKLLDIREKEEFYKVAPLIAAERRRIEDDGVIAEMVRLTDESVEREFSVDPESKGHYQFQFVIAYVHAHVPAGLFTEMEGDRIMDYINDRWDLFENA